ncbi:replication endonuclease, partial [Escherichia coli]|nr:replication endonuclease [Escherichia coli]
LYVSEESLNRRAQQVKRNADLLESVEAENEEGYRATLAELAAKGVADKAIRRAELMTRIAGFEVIARDLGHAGEFITVTCPSRMHKFTKTKHGKVIPNRKYDGTTPGEARAYLSDMWAKLRAWLDRRG